jgi:hypothetical protein
MATPMTRASRINAVLFTLAALLWALLWLTQPKPQRLLEAISVLSVSIERQATTERYQRDRCGWIGLDAPIRRGQSAVLDRIAALATAPTLRKIDSVSDRAAIGLESPLVVVRLNDQRVAIGGVDPINGWRYVEHEGRVALIEDRYADLASVTLVAPTLALDCPDA